MSKNFSINQGDKQRSVLTELIPYEVPVRFSFTQAYFLLRDERAATNWVRRIFFSPVKDRDDFIPYRYRIRTGEGKDRMLGMIHPLLFSKFAELYNSYGDLIVQLCTRSNWSLRKPTRVAKTYFVREKVQADLDPELPNDSELEAEFPKESAIQGMDWSAYFVYKPFNLLQKFFGSRDLLCLERRFSKCKRLDVAKCFENIYSHSISWAVKGKELGKLERDIRHSFDNRFDRLMQKSNHSETHGILIGAEISRIFAEIILQAVDMCTERVLTAKNLIGERDYSVRRYIDDYFIFFNDEIVCAKVQESIERELAAFKLYLNEKKSVGLVRPFVTPITAAKSALRSLIRSEFSLPTENVEIKEFKNRINSRRILNEVRSIVAHRGVEFSEISGALLKDLQVLVQSSLYRFREEKELRAYRIAWWRAVIEIAYYMLSVDVRFRTSVIVARIISDVRQSRVFLPDVEFDALSAFVMAESVRFLREATLMQREIRLELANLLICLKEWQNSSDIPPQLLDEIFSAQIEKEQKCDYFVAVGLVFFCGDEAKFKNLKNKVVETLVTSILTSDTIKQKTETFCLTLDLVSCPFVNRSLKLQLAKKFMIELGTHNPSESETGAFLNEIGGRTWFFDWRSEVSNASYLRKKELSISY